MNKFLKLALIPVALTVFGGCAGFHNALRNVRHSIERATKKKAPGPKMVASSIACRENLDKSIRAARNDVEQQLEDKRIKGKVETSPEKAPVYMWPNLDESNTYSSVCALAWAYEEDSPPASPPEPEKIPPPEQPDATEESTEPLI